MGLAERRRRHTAGVQIAVLLTVHNRRALTLRCLDSLESQRGHDADVSVFLCDDGSTDGSASAVAAGHPEVTVVQGDGTLFYNGGMRAAWAAAKRADPDAYLWINDDTVLVPDALARLRATWQTVMAASDRPTIVVGAVCSPGDGVLTYGGVRQGRVRRVHFALVPPTDQPQTVDTMNGNCVLVPRNVHELVGSFDQCFRHSMGDFDYGLRARALGCDVVLAAGFVGTCRGNPGFQPRPAGVRQEWRRLRSVKHLPATEWTTFVRRWGGPAWPVLLVVSYARAFARILASGMRALPRLRTRPAPDGG